MEPPTISNVDESYSNMPEHLFRQKIHAMKEAGTLGIYHVNVDYEDEDEPEVEEFDPEADEQLEDSEQHQPEVDISIFDEMESRFNKLKTIIPLPPRPPPAPSLRTAAPQTPKSVSFAPAIASVL